MARKTYEELNELKKKYNNIIIEEEYSFIELKNRKKEITGYAIIDTEDIELILEYRWYKSKDGYAVYADRLKKFNTSYITMHGLIMNCLGGFKITPDHKNLNRLDNRKENLRLSERCQQQMNHNLNSKNTSGIIGVNWDNYYNKWLTRISIDKISTYVGRYNTFEEAIKARLKSEIKYYGEFAPQKHLFEQYGIEDNNEKN